MPAGDWWESISLYPDLQLTHPMVSDALWYAVMRAGRSYHYRYYHFPRSVTNPVQRQEVRRFYLAKLEALGKIATELHNMGVLLSNPNNFKALHGLTEQATKHYLEQSRHAREGE